MPTYKHVEEESSVQSFHECHSAILGFEGVENCTGSRYSWSFPFYYCPANLADIRDDAHNVKGPVFVSE